MKKIISGKTILLNTATNCTFVASDLDERVQTGTRDNDGHIEWAGELDVPVCTKKLELLKEEYYKYVKPYNKETGVDGIDDKDLKLVNLLLLPKVINRGLSQLGKPLMKMSNGKKYEKCDYTPRRGTTFFKPSFAGRQVLIGLDEDNQLIYSNGRWFES